MMTDHIEQQAQPAPDRPPFAWTPAAVEALRTRWEKGKTASQIAAALGTTKNAVISKAHRLKLPQHGQQGKTMRRGAIDATPRITRSGRTSSQGLATQVANVRAERNEQPKVSRDPSGLKALKSAAWDALPGSTPVPLVDLERGQCKWPIGDAPILFCGLAADGVYCATHGRLSRSAAK